MNRDQLLESFRQMQVMRHLDEMLFALKMKDLVMDGFHPYSGEEACAVGASLSLRKDDYVISNHRPQGHSLAKGTLPRSIFAEMLGRRGGVSEGIGGPMQWIDAGNNFYCGSIVGSGMTIATGVAMAMKREGKGRVVLCYFGDGASNTGSFHEAMNLAAIWNLPVVYVLENNQYAEAMPVREFVSVYPISKRGASYGIEGITVDGNDVEAVHEAVGAAITKARTGEGPYFIECMTYRTRGHYGGDPEHTYRTKEEVDAWKEKCPIKRLRARLLESGVLESELDVIEADVVKHLESERDWALEQRFPTVDEATDHVLFTQNQAM
jgi:TPP-dependent pyruvate/acetoin dehydrogenase alpha subunit